MAQASEDGVYTTTDEHGRVHRFKARKGDALPEGATVEGAPKKRKKQAKTGPSETTESASEPETT